VDEDSEEEEDEAEDLEEDAENETVMAHTPPKERRGQQSDEEYDSAEELKREMFSTSSLITFLMSNQQPQNLLKATRNSLEHILWYEKL